jgi:hypothetical protein
MMEETKDDEAVALTKLKAASLLLHGKLMNKVFGGKNDHNKYSDGGRSL